MMMCVDLVALLTMRGKESCWCAYADQTRSFRCSSGRAVQVFRVLGLGRLELYK